jgi:hypothetical protein
MRSPLACLLFFVLASIPFLHAQIMIEEIEPLEDDDPRVAAAGAASGPRTNLSIEYLPPLPIALLYADGITVVSTPRSQTVKSLPLGCFIMAVHRESTLQSGIKNRILSWYMSLVVNSWILLL